MKALRRGIGGLSAALVLLANVVVGGLAPGAAAQEGLLDSPTLSMWELGANDDLAIYGRKGSLTLNFEVPKGLFPVSLNAIVEVPPNVAGATLAVTQDNRTVSRIGLPLDGPAPISIPLDGVRLNGTALTVALESRLFPVPGYCLYDDNIPLLLNATTVSFDGVETVPTVVADFLPPLLKRLTIFVPETASRAETAAALQLTTAAVARYGKQGIDVDLVPMAGEVTTPWAPSQPFERQIVIRESDELAVRLQARDGVPSLLITGSGADLENQARLLGSDVLGLALAPTTVAGPLLATPKVAPNSTTLDELGQVGLSSQEIKPSVSIGLDQTRFGRPITDVRMHLRGTYTPLPSPLVGQIVVSVGDQAIDQWQIESGGVIDREVTIPNMLLERYTSVGVALDFSGDIVGDCDRFEPVMLRIDEATVIESEPAKRPEPAGFGSLPQALMPRIQVGVGGDGFDDAVRAVTIIEGLQRLSAVRLDTEVVSAPQAVDSQAPAVVISASGWDSPLTLPVAIFGDNQLEIEPFDNRGATTLTLDPARPLGSLQTVFDGDRTLLVATSNDAAGQLDALLEWLDDDPGRWSQLQGTAVIMASGYPPVTVNTETTAEAVAPAESRSLPLLWIGATVAGVVFAGAVAALLILRRRRRTPRSEGPPPDRVGQSEPVPPPPWS